MQCAIETSTRLTEMNPSYLGFSPDEEKLLATQADLLGCAPALNLAICNH
jgi:hypothetical protein